MKSEKGKDMLIIHGFKFSFQKLIANGVKRWICAFRKTLCKAFIKTSGDGYVILDSCFNHNHELNIDKTILNRQILSNSIKRKAVEDICERPMKIIHSELKKQNCATTDTVTSTDVIRFRKNLYAARRTVLPRVPKSLEEVHEYFLNHQIKTNKMELFMVKNDTTNNIIMFTCETNLRFLSNVEHIYLDGTFQYAPKFFLQLFTVHGLKNNHYVPLVYFLLPDKKTDTYKQSFTYLQEEAKKCGFQFSPKTVTADFETAIHKAVQEKFSNSTLKGCRFHLGQSW